MESLKTRLQRATKFEENILKAFENRKLIFFLGAGVSRVMGVQGWNEFSTTLVKRAFPSHKEQATILKEIKDNKERITIAYSKFLSDGKLEEFYKYFGEALKPDPSIFNSKENVYEILSKFEATFLTTNADNLFEEVLGSALCHEDCEISTLRNEHDRVQNRLFYLHGHYTDDINIHENNLVFTAPQYVKRYNNQAFGDFLRAIFKDDNNTIVFIGYGLNEFELIDYIITKSGYTKNSERRVYLLYGFCDNEEILWKAKTAYFNELNIDLIEYDISEKGYDSIIDVLKVLLKEYQEKTIVPVTPKITLCTETFTEKNYAEISRLLKNEHFAKTYEPQIVAEIQHSKSFAWAQRFYEDGIFSPLQLTQKLEYRAWPLLELFVEWIESEDEEAQTACTTFLDAITREQIQLFAQTHTYIHSYLFRMIFALNKSNIKPKHLSLLRKIGKKNNLLYYELANALNYKCIVSWSKKILTKLLNVIFEKVDLDEFRDNMSYSIQHFFKHLNQNLKSEKIILLLLDYLITLLVDFSTSNTYCLLSRVNDLDNIVKNDQENWTAIFNEINFLFNILPQSIQEAKIKDLLSKEHSSYVKFGLYFARKYDHNIASDILDAKFFSSTQYFHECYLLLKRMVEKNFFLDDQKEILCQIIHCAHFGLDACKECNSDGYYTRLELSKRLLLLQLLACPQSKATIDELLKEGITPYESEKVAELCDYIRDAQWDHEVYITLDMFTDIPTENWCQHVENLCKKQTDYYILASSCRQFSAMVANQSATNISTVIHHLKTIKPLLASLILYELVSNQEKIACHTDLAVAGLGILDTMQESSLIDKDAANNIFQALSKIDIQDEDVIKKAIRTITPWLNNTIDGERVFNDDSHILTNLINYGDFYKISVLLNCFVALRKSCDHTLTAEEVQLLLDILRKDNTNRTGKYTLCYYYQNLKFISHEDSHQLIIDSIFDEEPFDMVALLFCILNSNHLFNELVEKVKSKYLSIGCVLSPNCKDHILLNRFHSFIIASRYYNLLTQEEFQKAFNDSSFLNHFIHSINAWAQKENFNLLEWVAPCWEYIKENCKDSQLQKFAEDILHSVDAVSTPTEGLLNLYLDVVEYCNKKACVYAKIPSILLFFTVNPQKTSNLLYKIFSLDGYTNRDDLQLVLLKYKEYHLEREGRPLLNMLSQRGEISNQDKEKLAEIFN